ncbi:hypothetical protein JCM9279_004099 [Rhodotorula babjevae]
MSDLKPGPCLVCGVTTKNRCSSGAKTGISLMFCSAAHQRLVWHAHKHFCGPGKAHPFQWPLLTEDEAREVIANKRVGMRGGRSLVEYLPSIAPHDVDTLVRACTRPGPSILPGERISSLLTLFRFLEYMRSTAEGRFRTPDREVDVLRRIAGFYTLFALSSLLPHDSRSSAPLILHQHVVHHALSESSDRTANAGRRDPELKQLSISSLTRLRELVAAEPAIPARALIRLTQMEDFLVREKFVLPGV